MEKPENRSRKKFNEYPIYLRNTVFHNDDETLKLRELSITERAFIWDKYKAHGNKNYHKNNIKKALFFYERVCIHILKKKINAILIGIQLFQMAHGTKLKKKATDRFG